MKQGFGTFDWADGTKYVGNWSKNTIHGYGEYHWPDLRSYKGEWKMNKLHGKGLYSWPDGRSYDGQYTDDKKQGWGTYIWPEQDGKPGKKYEGYWYNGKQHGTGVLTAQKDGEPQIGIWEKGKQVRLLTKEDIE